MFQTSCPLTNPENQRRAYQKEQKRSDGSRGVWRGRGDRGQGDKGERGWKPYVFTPPPWIRPWSALISKEILPLVHDSLVLLVSPGVAIAVVWRVVSFQFLKISAHFFFLLFTPSCHLQIQRYHFKCRIFTFQVKKKHLNCQLTL